MKVVDFQGEEFSVPDKYKYITRDSTGTVSVHVGCPWKTYDASGVWYNSQTRHIIKTYHPGMEEI